MLLPVTTSHGPEPGRQTSLWEVSWAVAPQWLITTSDSAWISPSVWAGGQQGQLSQWALQPGRSSIRAVFCAERAASSSYTTSKPFGDHVYFCRSQFGQATCHSPPLCIVWSDFPTQPPSWWPLPLALSAHPFPFHGPCTFPVILSPLWATRSPFPLLHSTLCIAHFGILGTVMVNLQTDKIAKTESWAPFLAYNYKLPTAGVRAFPTAPRQLAYLCASTCALILQHTNYTFPLHYILFFCYSAFCLVHIWTSLIAFVLLCCTFYLWSMYSLIPIMSIWFLYKARFIAGADPKLEGKCHHFFSPHQNLRLHIQLSVWVRVLLFSETF